MALGSGTRGCKSFEKVEPPCNLNPANPKTSSQKALNLTGSLNSKARKERIPSSFSIGFGAANIYRDCKFDSVQPRRRTETLFRKFRDDMYNPSWNQELDMMCAALGGLRLGIST